MSQARLSELERGGGSFSAEQFLEILRLFQVGVGSFDDAPTSDDALHNALIRHGATHLQWAPSASLTDAYDSAAEAVVEVLLNPESDRLVTALAPALVWSIDAVALPALQHELALAGVPNRLPWLCENTQEALRLTHGDATSPEWQRRGRRAEAVLGAFVPRLGVHDGADFGPDPFDRGVRSKETLDQVWREASPISRRWNVASALTADDFARALRGAHESGP